MPPTGSQQNSFRPHCTLIFWEPLCFSVIFFFQTPGGIPCCQLFSCHDDPSFPEGRARAVHSPSCIALELLLSPVSHVGRSSKLPAGKPPGSLQEGSWNNQSLPFSGAFQQRISKHTDPEANQAEREQLAGQWWDGNGLSGMSSGQEVLDLSSTLALTPTCLPLL